MEAESYLDLLPEEIWQRVNRIVRAHPTFAMIMDLPYELQMYVAVQMPYPDVLRFCASSTKAKKVCDNDFFWKWKVEHDFPKEAAEGYEGRWRKMYEKYWKEKSKKLISCAREGHIDCVESQLQFGIDPNFRGEDGYTALISTSISISMYQDFQDAGIIKLLLDHGADPNIQSDDKMTALMWLSIGGTIDDVRLLLKHGAKTNFKNASGITALLFASGNNVRVDLVRLLLESNANPNARNNKWKETPLMHASERDHADVVQLLLEYGADTELQNVDGKTALDLASEKGYTNIVRLLSE